MRFSQFLTIEVNGLCLRLKLSLLLTLRSYKLRLESVCSGVLRKETPVD